MKKISLLVLGFLLCASVHVKSQIASKRSPASIIIEHDENNVWIEFSTMTTPDSLVFVKTMQTRKIIDESGTVLMTDQSAITIDTLIRSKSWGYDLDDKKIKFLYFHPADSIVQGLSRRVSHGRRMVGSFYPFLTSEAACHPLVFKRDGKRLVVVESNETIWQNQGPHVLLLLVVMLITGIMVVILSNIILRPRKTLQWLKDKWKTDRGDIGAHTIGLIFAIFLVGVMIYFTYDDLPQQFIAIQTAVFVAVIPLAHIAWSRMKDSFIS